LDSGNVSTLSYSIPPKATKTFSTISGSAAINGYALVVPNTGSFAPEASVILTHRDANQKDTLRETVEGQIPGTDFRLLAELSGDFNAGQADSTVLAFAITNPSSTATTVTLTLAGMNGVPTGLTTTLTLPAQGHLTAILNQLDAFKTMPNPFQGILLVHASDPGISVVGMRQRIGAKGALIGTTTGPISENAVGTAHYVFPHILDGGGNATQFFLFSAPMGHGTPGTLTFANDTGGAIPLTLKK
jgi:hypothetical protein